jgi:hypothetical protein
MSTIYALKNATASQSPSRNSELLEFVVMKDTKLETLTPMPY